MAAMPTFICDAVATQRDHLDALVTPQELPNSSAACTTRASHSVRWMYGMVWYKNCWLPQNISVPTTGTRQPSLNP
jgi:hypothetical protein